MTSLFVDTAALIALGNKRDQFHEQALTIRKALIKSDTLLFTSNLVIAEFCNAFSALHLRSTAVQYIESIYHSTKWTVIGIDAQWFTQGFELYKKCRIKNGGWWIVRASSLLSITTLNTSSALTIILNKLV